MRTILRHWHNAPTPVGQPRKRKTRRHYLSPDRFRTPKGLFKRPAAEQATEES